MNKNSLLLEIDRYNHLEYRYLTTSDFSTLQQMNTEYPVETRTLIEDVVEIGEIADPDINTEFLKFYQDMILQSVIAAVESEFTNTEDLDHQFSGAFRRLKQALPNIATPRAYAQISALDQSVVMSNGTIGISLDKYLGLNYPLYAKSYLPTQRKQMSCGYIPPDCVTLCSMSIYPLQHFESRPRVEHDLQIGKIQWIVNQVMTRRAYHSRYEEAVGNYTKKNLKTTYEKLSRMTDFSKFTVMEN